MTTVTSVFPERLIERERRVREELYREPHWYACYTRARHEKRVDGLLGQRGIETFLPLIHRVRQWKDRKKVVPWPLFPSYVFGRFTLDRLHAVLTTPGVSTVVRTNGYPTPIPDHELENVRRFTAAVPDAGIEPRQRPLVRAGQRVRITEGPFRDIEGVVVEVRGRQRVLIGISAIRQGFEVDIDAKSLEPIRGTA